jgi:hypothetical protein
VFIIVSATGRSDHLKRTAKFQSEIQIRGNSRSSITPARLPGIFSSVSGRTGEKDVAVNFNAVKKTTKDNKVYLTMNTTKDQLKSATGWAKSSWRKSSWEGLSVQLRHELS